MHMAATGPACDEAERVETSIQSLERNVEWSTIYPETQCDYHPPLASTTK